jgi:S-adenosylmethionine synthetase
MKKLLTAESVGKGHPDKICDQISDTILDEILKQDPNSRVAVNAAIKNYTVFVFGEVTTKAKVDYVEVVKELLREIGLSGKYTLISEISTQSPDIAQGVDTGGAGDQGTVIGYACNETPEYLPLPIAISHRLMREMDRYNSILAIPLGPDGKCQVTINYTDKGPVLDTIVFSMQHPKIVSLEKVKHNVGTVIENTLIELKKDVFNLDTSSFSSYINNTGTFIIGGSFGDSGLTGRKIIVDTYGPSYPHGGGAFSGKDYTKVDRSGAYAARWLAKNIVAAGLLDECGIQISYAIGKAEPVAVLINGKLNGIEQDTTKLSEAIMKNFPLTPAWIQSTLDLKRPIYRQTAVYGHFGRLDLDLPWERLDLVEMFKENLR